MLEGDELAAAKRVVDSIYPAMVRLDVSPDGGLKELTRIVYESGGLIDSEPRLFQGLAAGASAVGEKSFLLCDHTSRPGAKLGEFSALRVESAALIDWFDKVVRNRVGGDDGWTSPALKEWPNEAREIADPAFVSDWIVTSESGSWLWADEIAQESCLLTADREFLDGYRKSDPKIVLHPIYYLHGDGCVLLDFDFRLEPSKGGLKKLLGIKTKIWEEASAYSNKFAKYLEPLYGEAGARRIHEIFRLTDDLIDDDIFQLGSWEDEEAAIVHAVDAIPNANEDLLAIWNGEYGQQRD